ncbi:MAG TPA: T9SS type A sorting domain-containing protein [Bacteroidia bacterium]|jgi:hypothetical protein|nr:T9SS type A sorting domain-containing protein [Bacteroidia bacterium]
MNKHLLLGTALLVAISAFPQAGKLTKPSGVLPFVPKKLDYKESGIMNAASFSGTPKQIKNVTKANANKTSSTIASNRFTGSMNLFGYLVSQSRPLQYKPGINAVSMIARKDGTYTASSNSNSGTIVGHWTTNLGTSWDETCIWSNAVNLARYPNGGIYNPSGNTNINNAYLVGSGPITNGTNWIGNWYASKQITTPGNTTGGADQQSILSASSALKKHGFARYSFNTIEGGMARSIAEVENDPNGTTYPTIGYRGAAMVKGVFSAGVFVWSVDSFCPPVNTRPADASRIVFGAPIQAWDDAGQNGYVILFGSRAGELANATHAGPKGGIQPIVYKTSTGGTSWALLPSQDFADPVAFKGVYDRTFPIATNSNVIIANFQGSEGYDAAVDVNGQLHLASMLYGHNQSQLDSLGYRYVFGTEQWSWGEKSSFNFPTIYDFYTKPTGGWDYIMVDSMGTEGPSGTSGQPGYGSNLWSDGSGARMAQDARLQMSRSTDGKKLFYSWTESDTTIANLKWNIYPAIKWKGYDVTINKVTPRMDATAGDPNVDQLAYFQYMCDKAVGASSVCMTMPFTVTKNAGYDGSVNVDTYFLGDQVCPTSFSINPMHPLGVTTINNPAVNFDVFNYPNPASQATTIIIGLKKAGNLEVVLYNSVGQMLTTYKINGQLGANEINVDLSGYSAGVYFYNVKVGNSVVTKKLIVQ